MIGSKSDYIVALDVGTSFVRTVIAQLVGEGKPRIVGVGVSKSDGIRRGVITDLEDVTRCIGESVRLAEQNSGVKVGSAYVSVGGVHIQSMETKGVVAVGRADGIVSEEDVERVITSSQAISLPPNREIVHMIPQRFRLDDQEDIKSPVGMSGVRLEMQGMIITGSSPHLRNLEKCFSDNEIVVDGFIAVPLASAKAVLNKRQKELGVVVAEIGGGTVALAVFEEQQLLHTVVLPIGAGHVTNDVAIGLRTSVETAEKIKLRYGSALPDEISRKEEINLAEIDENEEGTVSRKHVAEIIQARMEEIFFLVEKELKKINRSALLPAGCVLTGGGSCVAGVVDLAKEILKLPAQVGFPGELSGLIDKVDNPSFAVVTGMINWALEEGTDGVAETKFSGGKMGQIFGAGRSRDMVNSAKRWLEKMLP